LKIFLMFSTLTMVNIKSEKTERQMQPRRHEKGEARKNIQPMITLSCFRPFVLS
jgi:hypothetical protein